MAHVLLKRFSCLTNAQRCPIFLAAVHARRNHGLDTGIRLATLLNWKRKKQNTFLLLIVGSIVFLQIAFISKLC